MGFKVGVKGIPEFEAKMKLLGTKSITPVMREKVLKPGAKEIWDSLGYLIGGQHNVTRGMFDALVVRLVRDQDVPAAYVAFDMSKITKRDRSGRKVRYPYMVNAGTKPHKILARPGGALHFAGHFGQWVDHPGSTKGKGFFQKGVRQGRNRAGAVMEAAMKSVVDGLLASGPAIAQ